jgi:glutamine synthetase
MTATLSTIAREQGIRYFLISFTDLFGVQRAKLVPAAAIEGMARDGAGFAGFAAWLQMTPADADVLAIPDPDALTVLPWKPDVAWLPADLTLQGEPLQQTPRQVLKRQVAAAADLGLRVRTGVECEFFLISPDGQNLSDPLDHQVKPCYDQQALMRRYELLSELSDAMLSLGWGPYQTDHEDANGQFEMNWTYADALVTADRQAFFKYMVRSLAEKHGLRATFMPKPFAGLTGNGCHTHLSVWDLDGTANRFSDPTGELGLSSLAYQFIAGVLTHAEALCAITNPTVNSYKRINAPVTTSGATWSPNGISYGGNNRTHLIRIPDAGRFEFRLADGAANPYLLPAALIAAGLDGLTHQLDPGPRRDNNMYTHPPAPGEVRTLPANLLDALRALEDNRTLCNRLGLDFCRAYLALKQQEWSAYSAAISPWELANTLDC